MAEKSTQIPEKFLDDETCESILKVWMLKTLTFMPMYVNVSESIEIEPVLSMQRLRLRLEVAAGRDLMLVRFVTAFT